MDENKIFGHEILDNFPKFLNNLKNSNSVEHQLWDFIELLLIDLESCKKHNSSLEKQLDSLIIKELSSLCSTNFIALEERNAQLERDNTDLKEKTECQIKALQLEKIASEQNYEMKLNFLNEELKIMNQKFKQKEKEFFDELQVAQADFASKFEKIEQKLKWQIEEANRQVREVSLINSKLHTQLQNLENQKNHCQNDLPPPTSKKMLDKNDDTSSRVTHYGVLNGSAKNLPGNSTASILNNPSNTCYEPLQNKSLGCESKSSEEISRNQTILYRGKNSSSIIRKGTKQPACFKVPPLLPCSNSKRRRKLHDPEDMSYLNILMPTEQH